MRILFAWEMGHNFGHVTQIAVIARALKKQAKKLNKDAEIFMALKTPDGAVTFAEEFSSGILQAPYHPPARKRYEPPLTYAEGLLPCGYDDPEILADLIKQWRALFKKIKPDILIAQAAPTALIASRGLEFKRMNIGKSFDLPPLSTPMLPLRYWEKQHPDIPAREEKIVATINAALKKCKLKPVKNFAQAVSCDKEFLCMFRELDHYPKRPETPYYGPLYVTGTGEKIRWNNNSKKRIFSYIVPAPPSFMAVMECLRAAPPEFESVMVNKELSPMMIEKLQTPRLRILTKPVKLDELLKDCDVAITNANPALGSALMMAGVPALMLPLHIEQHMYARAAGRAGIGLSLVGNIKPPDITRKIKEILGNEKFRRDTRALSQKYKEYAPEKTAAGIAKEIFNFI